MSRRLFDYDPFTGITQYFSYDEATDVSTIESWQDVEPELEACKKLQNTPEYTRMGMKREWLHVGHIPAIIIEKWIAEKGVNVYKKECLPAVFSLLNHPDYGFLKTTNLRHLMKEKFGRIWNIGSNKASKVHA